MRQANGQDPNVRADDTARREPQGTTVWSSGTKSQWRETRMNNIFWIIGVIVVVLVVLSFLGLR
ncbi:MAG: hypothetical protein EHM39_13265 [Chloroflexi bacterium]|nr:MAG: hypothetical protein EHM39_13265 [Chloroflexota bacterium]